MSFRLTLSVEHKPDMSQPTAKQQIRLGKANQNVLYSLHGKSVFLHPDNWETVRMAQVFAPTFRLTDLRSFLL